MAKNYAVLDNIIAYEAGDLRPEDILILFSELIKSGMAWSLQGSYGRQAAAFIEAGYITDKGKILKDIEL